MPAPLTVPKKLLVAVDGSESANIALDYAVALAEKLGATIVVTYVVELPGLPQSMMLLPEIGSEYEGMVRDTLSYSERVVKERKIPCETKFVRGNPPEKIPEAARESSCDCKVVGKRGIAGSKGSFREVFQIRFRS